MYKSIKWLNGDPNPLKKLVDVYVSSVSANVALRQVASIVCHPNELGRERATCIEQVDQVQSHLIMVQGELDAIKEKHREATQKVVKLKEALGIAYEEEQQL